MGLPSAACGAFQLVDQPELVKSKTQDREHQKGAGFATVARYAATVHGQQLPEASSKRSCRLTAYRRTADNQKICGSGRCKSRRSRRMIIAHRFIGNYVFDS